MKKKLFALFTLLFTSCNYINGDEEKLLDKAEKALLNGEISSANIFAKKALLKNINNGHARFIMAEAANLRGKTNDAEIDYRRAYEAGYDIKKVLPPFIENLIAQQNHNDIPALIQNLPDDMQAQKFYWQGLFYLGDNYLDKAENAFNESLNISNNKLAIAFFGLALVAINRNDFNKALNFIDKSLTHDEQYLDALLLKAEIYTKQNKDTLALPILLSILNRNINTIPAKKHFIAKSTLIQIYWRRKEIALTEKHVHELLKRYKDNPIANYYGAMISFQRKKYSLANNFLQGVLRISPEHTASLGLMGSVKYQQGFYEQADFYLSSALVNEPNNPELSKLLAATRLKQNQTSSAISLLDSTSTRESDPLILWLSGKAEIQAGNTDSGLVLLKKAIKLSPTDSESMQLDIAQTYLSMGKLDQAILELDNLSNTETIDKQKELFYIYDHIQKGDFNKALRETKILISKKPDELHLYIALGNIFIAMQQDTQAIDAFKKAAAGENVIKANLLLAKIYIKNQDYVSARKAFKTILDIEKNHFEALAGLVRLAILEQDKEGYEFTIKNLQAQHPQNPNTFLIEARKQLSDKDFSNAEHTLKKVIQLDNENVTGILMLTSCFVQNNKLNAAIFFLEDKLTLPELKSIPHLFYKLAILYESNNNTDKAIKATKKAFKLRPESTDYLFTYTKLLKRVGKQELALSTLEDFITKHPKSSRAHILLGDFLYSQKLFDKALNVYQDAKLIESSEELAIKLLRVQRQLNKPSANIALEDWLQANPDSQPARAELAGYQLSQGNFKAAIREYEILTKQQPENPVLFNNLAWAYQQVNNRLAIKTAEYAYKLAPNSPEIADTYGWILVNMGKLADGLSILDKAYSSKPSSVDIQYHLAYALVKSKQHNRAQKLLNAMLDNESAKAFHASVNTLLNEIP